MCVCASLYVCVPLAVLSEVREASDLGIGVTANCEPHSIGAGNSTCVICKSTNTPAAEQYLQHFKFFFNNCMIFHGKEV